MTQTEAVETIAIATLGHPDLSADDNIQAIAEDSLSFVWALQQIESAWGNTFDDKVIGNFKTVGDIADWMVSH